MTTEEITKYEKLLEQFSTLPKSKERLPTYLEIAGYPHYENVISNLLAFFFDPAEVHGLGTLAIESLCEAAGKSDMPISGDLVVEREINVGGGRIDILISGEQLAIAIENKIYHDPNNPFHLYACYLNNKFPTPQHEHLKRVLTPFPQSIPPSRLCGGFQVLGYSEWFAKLKPRMGSFAIDASPKYWTLLLELISTIENIAKGYTMDSATRDFFLKNAPTIRNFLITISNHKQDLRKKLEELKSSLGEDTQIGVFLKDKKQGFWRRSEDLYDVLYYDFSFDEGGKKHI